MLNQKEQQENQNRLVLVMVSHGASSKIGDVGLLGISRVEGKRKKMQMKLLWQN